jgi:hypothetical protein
MLNVLFWFNFLAGLLGFFVVSFYCMTNNSGHTGFNPVIVSFLFTPVVFIGIWGCMKNKVVMAARLSVVVGLSGFVLGFFVKYSGIMNQYGAWLQSGKNPQNPHADLLLTIYGSIVLFLLIASIRDSLRKQKA